MTVTATFDGHDLNAGPYRLLDQSVAFLSAPEQRSATVPLGGSLPGGVLVSRADDARTLPVTFSVTAGDAAGLEANVATLKGWLRPPRRRLVISAIDSRFWIATCTGVHVEYVSATYAVATCTFTIERPYQEEAACRAAVSTSPLATTFDTTPAGQGINNYKNLIISHTPVVYWRFGELAGAGWATDSGPSGISARYVGSLILGVAGAIAGDADTAMYNSNVNAVEYVAATSAAFDLGDTFSIELWFKPEIVAGVQTLVQGYVTAANAGGFRVKVDAAGHVVLTQLVSNAAENTICTSTGTLSVGAYHHIVVTKSGSNVHIYIDNTDVTGAITNQTVPAGMTNLNVGALWDTVQYSQSFGGAIDEFALYPLALSSQQVNEHYQLGIGNSFTRFATTVSMTVAPDANTPVPVRALLTLPAGSVTASRFLITNVTAGRRDAPRRITTFGQFPAQYALLFDPRRMAVTKLNLGSVAGWWPFCMAAGAANDFGGANRDLTANGAITYLQDGPDDGPGMAGGDRPACGFDGVTGYFSSTSTAFDIGAGDFSVGAWVRPDTNASGVINAIMGKASANAGWALVRDVNGYLNFGYGTGAAAGSFSSNVTRLVAGRWYFVVATHQAASGRIRLYVNGVLDFQSNHPGAIAASANPLRVGGATWVSGAVTAWWPGRITEPFIITVEMTPAQVYQVYEYGSLVYYSGAAQDWYEQFPEVDPDLGATNTFELSTYAFGTPPSTRLALAARTRYA